MKKLALLSLAGAAILALGSNASAQDSMNGGFSGPGSEVVIMTVEQAKGLTDEAMVVLRGNIQKKIGDEMYVFVDTTGSINVEIDDEDWNGMNIGAEDMVEIKGEVDKGWTSVEIDVDQIQKVNP